MHGKERAFTFFLTGMEDNDTAIARYVRNQGYKDVKLVLYKLEYVPPFQNFGGIALFEQMTKYRPFVDSIQKKAVAVIDLSEWIGHEKEEYIEVFCKFLHDYDWSFHRYEYVFTVGAADKEAIRELYNLMAKYLGEDDIVEDRTMSDEKEMAKYLADEFPVDSSLAKQLSHIFVKNEIGGIAQMNTVMENFLTCIPCKKGKRLTEDKVFKAMHKLENSKLGILYKKDIDEWKQRLAFGIDKEEVA